MYYKCFECLILLLLIINEEFFYLLPRLGGQKNYQDALFPVILCIGVYFFVNKKPFRRDIAFLVAGFLGIILLGVLQAYFYGQPIILGIKAAQGFLIILIFFAFHAKEINVKRLFNLIIITGICIALLNNIQFVLFNKIKIFHYDKILMRVGELRFLIGGFFIIFAPILSLSLYFITRKKGPCAYH